jgi:hypothetical protein
LGNWPSNRAGTTFWTSAQLRTGSSLFSSAAPELLMPKTSRPASPATLDSAGVSRGGEASSGLMPSLASPAACTTRAGGRNCRRPCHGEGKFLRRLSSPAPLYGWSDAPSLGTDPLGQKSDELVTGCKVERGAWSNGEQRVRASADRRLLVGRLTYPMANK